MAIIQNVGKTSGFHRDFCNYLKRGLGDEYQGWAEYSFKNTKYLHPEDDRSQLRADLILWTPTRGLWVFEIKDWKFIHLFEKDKALVNKRDRNGNWELDKSGKPKKVWTKSPYVQVREYAACLREEFDECRGEIFRRTHFNESPSISRCVIFPRFTQQRFTSYQNREGSAVGTYFWVHSEINRTIFKDGLYARNGNSERFNNGRTFVQTITRLPSGYETAPTLLPTGHISIPPVNDNLSQKIKREVFTPEVSITKEPEISSGLPVAADDNTSSVQQVWNLSKTDSQVQQEKMGCLPVIVAGFLVLAAGGIGYSFLNAKNAPDHLNLTTPSSVLLQPNQMMAVTENNTPLKKTANDNSPLLFNLKKGREVKIIRDVNSVWKEVEIEVVQKGAAQPVKIIGFVRRDALTPLVR